MAIIPKNYARLESGYREKALKIYPWVCGRCSREFVYSNLRELTVHHIDHDHTNNPEDGSNWELLCLFCHDHEHSKYTEADQYGTTVVAGEDVDAVCVVDLLEPRRRGGRGNAGRCGHGALHGGKESNRRAGLGPGGVRRCRDGWPGELATRRLPVADIGDERNIAKRKISMQ